ncbi:uncharacterized protein METZ01_LOCUS228003 [marine metagenome]|uniref:NadR/Ttd14 AAA domain-containing protein n=1 Tax=marine metagenome TaxID=408172 RepID=A0A382GJL4_9ZZZZ
MRLILIGCEYSGTTTLSRQIIKWVQENLGDEFGFHDHWKLPHVSHPNIPEGNTIEGMWQDWESGKGPDPTMTGHTDEENTQFLALSPKIRESFQRYHMEYHMGDGFYGDAHHNNVGFYFDEAVYAPLYYGYGGPGEYADRTWYARHIEADIMHKAPDTVLVHVKASADVIRKRMKENPHKFSLLQDKDIETVLTGFAHHYEVSFLRHKFEIDTSTSSIGESICEFVGKLIPNLQSEDRQKIMFHRK